MINYSTTNFRDEVMRLTNNIGVNAVFDGVGAATFDGSMNSLRKRGYLVSFGNASGPVPAVEPLQLTAHGSIFLCRPTLAHFIEKREELEARAKDLYGWLKEKKLTARIAASFPLEQAAAAHTAIESRKYAGKILLHVRD